MKLNLTQSIGDSVTNHPELVKVYMDHGIDFCCGGNRSVLDAIKRDADDVEAVIKNAEKVLEMAEPFNQSGGKLSDLSNEALIDKIIKEHHVYLKAELPVLSDLLFKLLMVHGETHPELYEIHKLYGTLRLELEAHLVKEEKILFPLILSKEAHVKKWVDILEDEHDGAGEALHALTDLTDHFNLPEDACTTYGIVYEKLKHLIADMYMHVHSENNVLFKRFM